MARGKLDFEHYSVSQLNEFARCPYQYYLHRIEGVPFQPKYDLESGKAVHAGLEEHNRERARGRKGLVQKQIVERAVTYIEELKDTGVELDVNWDDAKDRVAKETRPPVGRYLTKTQLDDLEDMCPTSEDQIERLIEFTLSGHTFVGYLDLVLPKSIVDYKLIGKRKSANEVRFDPQLHIYTHALQLPGGLVEMVRGKETAAWTPQPQEDAIRRGVLKWAEETVRAIERAKKTGDFPPTSPVNWWCGQRCAYSDRCFGQSTENGGNS